MRELGRPTQKPLEVRGQDLSAVLRALAPYLARAYVSFVGMSSRIRWEGLEHLHSARNGGPFIYAFWHQRQVLFTYTHRGAMAPTVLVSRSRDGEIIAGTMRLFGIPAIRGSSSRGASDSARQLLELLAGGRNVALTPDGPRGPARQVKAGAIFLALKSGRPILPITNAVSRRLTVKKAWDLFQVPLPFSRICVCHGKPLAVRPKDDLRAKTLELKRELDRITEEADRIVKSPWPS